MSSGFGTSFRVSASLMVSLVGYMSKVGFETDKMQKKRSYIEIIDTAKALKKAISDRGPLGCHDDQNRFRRYSSVGSWNESFCKGAL